MKTNGLRYILIAGVCIVLLLLGYCQSGDTQGGKAIASDTVKVKDTTIIVFVHDTIQGEGKSVLKYTYSGVIRDTIIRNDSVFITMQDSTAFTATLDTIQQADTLHLEFTYPSAMFRYRLNRQADSVKVVNTYTTVTNTVPAIVPFYEKPLFVSGVTAAILVTIFSLTK